MHWLNPLIPSEFCISGRITRKCTVILRKYNIASIYSVNSTLCSTHCEEGMKMCSTQACSEGKKRTSWRVGPGLRRRRNQTNSSKLRERATTPRPTAFTVHIIDIYHMTKPVLNNQTENNVQLLIFVWSEKAFDRFDLTWLCPFSRQSRAKLWLDYLFCLRVL